MSIEFAQSKSIAYHEFEQKLKDDENVSYLLDEYPEIIDCLSVLFNQKYFKLDISSTLHRRYVQNIDCSRKGRMHSRNFANFQSFKYSEFLENSKNDTVKLESLLRQKEMELGILRKELKKVI